MIWRLSTSTYRYASFYEAIVFSKLKIASMGKSNSWHTLGIAIFAAIGTFFFGFDTGIA